MTRKVELNEKTISVLKDFLEDELSSRAAARELGISHQGLLNLVTSVLKEWYKDGKVKISLFTNGQENNTTTQS